MYNWVLFGFLDVNAGVPVCTVTDSFTILIWGEVTLTLPVYRDVDHSNYILKNNKLRSLVLSFTIATF
jgi:hypothetical protein